MSLIKQLIPNEKDNFTILSQSESQAEDAKFDTTFNYLTSNGNGGAEYNKTIKIENEVSFSIWFKLNSIKGMHLIDMRISDTQGYQPIYINDSKIQYHVGNSGISFEFSNSFKTEKWYHLCIRAKNEIGKIECWLNGQKLNKTFTDNPLPVQGEFPLYIGSRHSNRNDYFLDGQIKDVRIYNHWVSDYEIKELSKGLCCHYTFDDASNLLINSEKYTKNSPLVRQGSSVDNWDLSDMQCELIPNQTYIFQFKCNGNYSGKHYGNGGTGVDPSNRLCSVWFYLDKDSIPTTDSADSFFYIPQQGITDGPNGCKYYIYKNTDGYKYLKIRTNAYSNGTDQITINFWDFKLTLGDKLTPWTPYNSSYKINDNSGFNNNSIKVNNVGVTSSKIGSGAGLFNGTNSYVALPTSCKINPPFTYNVWAYMDDWTSLIGKTILSCTQSGGYGLFGGLFGEEKVDSLIFESYNKSNATYFQIAKALSELSDGWHMFTYSFDNDGTTKAYIDGESIGSITNDSFMYSGNANTIFLGGEAGGDTETPSPLTNCFNGRIDDFRLYSSVLSLEDIKDLYNCRMKIDNNHNAYCNEFVENNDNTGTQLTSTGTFNINNIVENEYMIMGDGSKFLKVFDHNVSSNPSDNSLYFSNENQAKQCYQIDKFSRLGELASDSFKSRGENKYEFLLKYYYDYMETFDEQNYNLIDSDSIEIDLPEKVNTNYEYLSTVALNIDGIPLSLDITYHLSASSTGGETAPRALPGNPTHPSLLTYVCRFIFKLYFPDGSTSSMVPERVSGITYSEFTAGLKLEISYNSNKNYFSIVKGGQSSVLQYYDDDVYYKGYQTADGEVCIETTNLSKKVLLKKEAQHLVGSKYNRWKQSYCPFDDITNDDVIEDGTIQMDKYWGKDTEGNVTSKGLGLNSISDSLLDTQPKHEHWYGGLGQYASYTENGTTGFPAPDGNIYQHAQLWVRVDNTNYDAYASMKNNVIYMNEFIEE